MTEHRAINTGGGDYREIDNSGNYAEGDIINLSGEQRQTLAEAAAEIQELLVQLDKTYNVETPEGKAAATTAALDKIKGDGKLKRLSSAGWAMAIATIKKAVDHPLVAGVAAGLEDWQKTKPKE